MRQQRLAPALATTFLLIGCSSDLTFENRSQNAVHDVRWVLKEEPEIAIDVGVVAPKASQVTNLPPGFGESSLWIGALRGNELLMTECGYIEAGGSYSAAATVQADGPIRCEVSLDGY